MVSQCETERVGVVQRLTRRPGVSMETELVLEHCTRAFADSWEYADRARPLIGGFVDAIAIFGLGQDGSLKLLVEGPGMDRLFGAAADDSGIDFVFRANRLDRKALVGACKQAEVGAPAVHVDVAWDVGQGVHAGGPANFFETITSVEHVGDLDGMKLLYLAFRDVNERRNAEHGQARALLSTALRSLFDEIFLLNLDTGANEPVYAGGRPLVKEDGTPIDCGFHAMFNTVHRDDVQLFWKYSNYLFVERELFGEHPSESIVFDLRRTGEDGAFHWARIYISRAENAEGRKLVLVCSQNVDEQKEAQRRERELRSKAQTDALTGIYNRGTSEELIRAKLQGLGPSDSALFAIVDVDDFKRVNDTYGHAKGDELLKAVASAVAATCRAEDIVGRMGGDEFVALFAGGDVPTREAMLSRFELCKKQVQGISESLGIDPPVTLSVGVVAVSAESAYSDAFDCADRLLYEAKRSGKNALFFS